MLMLPRIQQSNKVFTFYKFVKSKDQYKIHSFTIKLALHQNCLKKLLSNCNSKSKFINFPQPEISVIDSIFRQSNPRG